MSKTIEDLIIEDVKELQDLLKEGETLIITSGKVRLTYHGLIEKASVDTIAKRLGGDR